MDYQKIYEDLIANAKNKNIEGYYEKHHIIPRCIGGSNQKDNLVDLTPEEHYIAHLLLVKIYPSSSKLVYAANMMSNRNNKSYGWIKRRFVEQLSSDRQGFTHSNDAKQKMSLAKKGIPKSTQWKKQASEAKMLEIEYKGNLYKGFNHLKIETGISRHLYLKYYKKGIDPERYVNNNTYGMIEKSKTTPSRAAAGKVWCNNGIEEKYLIDCPKGWIKGRLFNNRGPDGRYRQKDENSV